MVEIPVRVTVTAVDSTSDAFKNISKNASKLNSELNSTTKSSGGLKTSVGDLAKGIFLGQVAFQAAQKALGFLVGSVKEGIVSAADSQRVWTQVATNISNAGISYSEVRKKIEEVSKANMQLGFTDEETAQSISRLTLATHDLNRSMEINRIAMDLARTKGISLESATLALTKAYTGNKMLLRQLGVEVDEVANREQVLALVHQQTADAAKRFSETTAGQMENIRVASDELKEQIGFALIPVIDFLMSDLVGLGNVGNLIIGVFRGVSSIVLGLALAVKTAGDVISITIATIAGGVQGFLQGGVSGLVSGVKNQLSAGADTMRKTWLAASKSLTQIWSGGMKEIGNFTKKTVDEVGDGMTQKAKEIANQIKKEVEDFARDTAKMTKNYERSLKDLVISHTKKTRDIKKSIEEENKDFNQSSEERKENYDEEMDDMKTEHERKVEDIKEQIDEETAKGAEASVERLADLQKTLEREIADFDKMVERKKKAYEDETAKAIEEHNKMLLALQEELDQELELQKKYGDDFAKYKDEQSVDDITRLKEAFKEEMDERRRQHEAKLEELKVQGLAEHAVSEAARRGDVNEAIKLQEIAVQTPVKKAGWKSKSSGEIRYEGGSVPWPVAQMADGRTKYSDGSMGWGQWTFGYYQKGGIVPGLKGQPQLAVVHGGERIMPATGQSKDRGGGETNITFNFSGTFLGSEVEMREYAMRIWKNIGQLAAAQNRTPEQLLNLRI